MVRQLLYLLRIWFGTILYDQRTFINQKKEILGQDLTFYSAEEVNIALNEGRLELNARVRIRAKDFNEAGGWFTKLSNYCFVLLFNEVVLEAAEYINDVLTKKKT
jgi:DNA-directed RNA polymerase subunit beta'